jgi:carboxymethylenebutenolidase
MNNSQMLADEGLVVIAQDITYGENAHGFYAAPEEADSYPGVVMIHEWWGLNQNIKDMASELAKQGYRVLAVDLFNAVAATPEEARAQIDALNQTEATGKLRAAAAYLREQGSTKVASLGWCFGGGQSLQLALSGEPLDATVIYYGNLVTDESRLSAIGWPVLGIFGEIDQSIPTSTVEQFGSALTSLGVKNNINIYPGVGHAFANPSGANYASEATKDAWAKTLAFLDEHLK